MDFELARFNMVEQQVRPWDVLDPEVLRLLFEVRREDFVPEKYRALAFADLEIPLGHGQTMLQPRLEGRMLQSLGLKSTDRVLEVGTGSGYFTALLARAAREVVSVEIVPELSAAAGKKLAAHGITNVTLQQGDAAAGWPAQAPYDAIVLTGSVEVLADAFVDSLKPGGRLVAVVGSGALMTAKLITRVTDGATRTDDLFETAIPPLKNTPRAQRFVF